MSVAAVLAGAGVLTGAGVATGSGVITGDSWRTTATSGVRSFCSAGCDGIASTTATGSAGAAGKAIGAVAVSGLDWVEVQPIAVTTETVTAVATKILETFMAVLLGK
ncbi:hypothetical protein [Aquabacterium sp.]|uniref:hypothetical protein n=1 Tax=Aquabacterium sp. TaxID=1872578 RepID=UPI002D1DDB02|nr:hypothetical protein [Aquabacterium sp.]HSW07488.1 hypothetical protein [Aquabacterium sp.]